MKMNLLSKMGSVLWKRFGKGEWERALLSHTPSLGKGAERPIYQHQAQTWISDGSSGHLLWSHVISQEHHSWSGRLEMKWPWELCLSNPFPSLMSPCSGLSVKQGSFLRADMLLAHVDLACHPCDQKSRYGRDLRIA